ncbi:DUF2752 domain-containing protein [Olivibacter ginsenosidimutans]|uniref:DUF2752 domain-containing protein n=1 Tax=Olivibacter ginsenosidimutans TaxID=1176537 RepID=UPI0031F09E70
MTRLRIRPYKVVSSISFLWVSSQDIYHWLQHHLLPCPFKYITGIDCPGCGFQRALLLLFQGQWEASIRQYPPTIPLLFLGAFFLLKRYVTFDHSEKIATILSCLVGGIIIAAYVQKMW